MTKKIVQTHLERMGFKDEELTTPKHDELMMMLNDDKTVLELFNELISKKELKTLTTVEIEDLEKKQTDDFKVWNCSRHMCGKNYEHRYYGVHNVCNKSCPYFVENDNVERNVKIKIQQEVKPLEIERIFEYEIRSDHYSLGFVDAVITIRQKVIMQSHAKHWKVDEGIIDSWKGKFVIEIKPIIKSFGETLRQMNFYRNHFPSDHNSNTVHYVIITPKTNFKEAFERQGIHVIEVG